MNSFDSWSIKYAGVTLYCFATRVISPACFFARVWDDFVKVKEGQDVVESGLQFTTKGKKRYEQLNKTEQDNFDKIANDYDLTLVERTTLRADGNIEIRMPDGKDEYIITKDGKLYKCK